MGHYTINSVEQLTGVKAHSLRAWEKRYKSLIPHRTATNIRFYDDDQLRKLLNIATLQAHGHRISRLMAMTDEELHTLLLGLAEPHGDSAVPAEGPVNSLVASMLGFDEPMFDKILSNAIIRLGMFEAMMQVVYPFLRKTGLLWSTDNATPAQEHFASNLLRRKLHAALDNLRYPPGGETRFLLFLPPGEQHEIGLLLSEYIIRHGRNTSVYLGQDLPYPSLEQAMAQLSPRYLVTFFTTGTDVAKHLRQLQAVLRHQKSTLLICSNAGMPPGVQLPGNVRLLTAPKDLIDFLD